MYLLLIHYLESTLLQLTIIISLTNQIYCVGSPIHVINILDIARIDLNLPGCDILTFGVAALRAIDVCLHVDAYLLMVSLMFFRDAYLICLVDTLTSVFAGFVIFAILGVMAAEKGTDVQSVVTSSGYSLIWVFHQIK